MDKIYLDKIKVGQNVIGQYDIVQNNFGQSDIEQSNFEQSVVYPKWGAMPPQKL